MKILIISDVHGNAEPLNAMTESYDELWVLGDLVNYGPEPAYVIRRLRQRATLIVRGNHDHAVGYDVDPRCSAPFRAMAEATRQHALKTLSEEDKHFLRDLPLTASVERDQRRFFLCHATPSDPLFAYCPPDSRAWVDESAAVDADVILVGHTHLPFVRRIGNRTVVNPGSLGQPKEGGPDASYAVWQDGELTLRKLKYPVDRTIAKIADLPLPTEITAALRHLLETGRPPTS
ncbi:MAG: YfcE family phosphodiesterase [Acidobacteria bacterium]|nr:YfcE family phosphodiesterase [Acidobacteriota bacterium]MCA1652306.1 YfcE family phosphodiesterase [Acidobacteriota bacterium]